MTHWDTLSASAINVQSTCLSGVGGEIQEQDKRDGSAVTVQEEQNESEDHNA